MISRRTLIGLVVAALLATAGYLSLPPPWPRHSPDLGLLTIGGEKLQLAGYRGRPLLVTFWATTCASCVRELPHLIELYEELHPRGLEIIGIAMAYDPPNLVLAMSRERNIPYPVALDIDSVAARAFGDIRVTPTTFLIAPDGRIVYYRIGTLDMAEIRQDILDMLSSRHGTARPAPQTSQEQRHSCYGSRHYT